MPGVEREIMFPLRLHVPIPDPCEIRIRGFGVQHHLVTPPATMTSCSSPFLLVDPLSRCVPLRVCSTRVARRIHSQRAAEKKTRQFFLSDRHNSIFSNHAEANFVIIRTSWNAAGTFREFETARELSRVPWTHASCQNGLTSAFEMPSKRSPSHGFCG